MKLKLRVSFREITELRGYLYYISGRAHWQPDLPWVMVTGINHWDSVCQLFPLRSCLFHISFPHSLVRNQNMWPIPSDTLPTARRHPLQQGHTSYECHSYEPMGANFMQTTTYIHTHTYNGHTHIHTHLHISVGNYADSNLFKEISSFPWGKNDENPTFPAFPWSQFS